MVVNAAAGLVLPSCGALRIACVSQREILTEFDWGVLMHCDQVAGSWTRIKPCFRSLAGTVKVRL